MAVEKSHARLGLFLAIALVIVIATAMLFLQRARNRAVIEMVTFTTENVSGLDVASPVRYRGVPVGRVSELRVDPRSNTIEIDFEVFLDRLNTIGANVELLRRTGLEGMFPTLRAQVIGNPVTGEAYLFLDAPENPPPPLALDFTPKRAYVPSMPTPLAAMRDRVPEILERAEATLRVMEDIISRIPSSLDRSDSFFTNVERIIQQSNLPALSADSRTFFATTSAQIEQIASELKGVLGTGGTLPAFVDEARTAIEEARTAIKAADLPATNQAARTAAEQTTLASDDLRRSLPAIRNSLDQLRDLARQLQEQPESVVYGPRPQAGTK